jgi:hypothetical protein
VQSQTLIDPPTLFFDDAPDRIAVQAWRWTEGWVLVYTHQFDEAGQLGGCGSFGHALTRSVDLGEVAASGFRAESNSPTVVPP